MCEFIADCANICLNVSVTTAFIDWKSFCHLFLPLFVTDRYYFKMFPVQWIQIIFGCWKWLYSEIIIAFCLFQISINSSHTMSSQAQMKFKGHVLFQIIYKLKWQAIEHNEQMFVCGHQSLQVSFLAPFPSSDWMSRGETWGGGSTPTPPTKHSHICTWG